MITVVLMVIGHIVVVVIANHPFKSILTKYSRYWASKTNAIRGIICM